jgi:hypothetical protein
MEQRKHMRRKYSRDQGWKRVGRGEESTAETKDGREEGVQQRRGMEERRVRGREYLRDKG